MKSDYTRMIQSIDMELDHINNKLRVLQRIQPLIESFPETNSIYVCYYKDSHMLELEITCTDYINFKTILKLLEKHNFELRFKPYVEYIDKAEHEISYVKSLSYTYLDETIINVDLHYNTFLKLEDYIKKDLENLENNDE
jgi:hypothetical protein